MADEKLSQQFFDVRLHLARTELESKLTLYRRESYRIAKQVAQEVAEGKTPMETLRKFDKFVRSVYANEPWKIAEWDGLMKDFDLSEEVVDDGK